MMIKKAVICFVVGSDQGNLLKKSLYKNWKRVHGTHVCTNYRLNGSLSYPTNPINDKLNWYSANELATTKSLKRFLT